MSEAWIQIIVALLGTGGFVGSIIAFAKLRPEAGQITVVAAQGALLVQKGVIEELHRELSRNREANDRLSLRVETIESEHQDCEEHLEGCRKRISQMERFLESHGLTGLPGEVE